NQNRRRVLVRDRNTGGPCVKPATIRNSIPTQHRVGSTIQPAVGCGEDGRVSTPIRKRRQSIYRVSQRAYVRRDYATSVQAHAEGRERRIIKLARDSQVAISLEASNGRDGARNQMTVGLSNLVTGALQRLLCAPNCIVRRCGHILRLRNSRRGLISRVQSP